MEEEKDVKLTNIYLRIHNRKALTMDDLAYLAKHNPVCFKKTCDNLFRKMSEPQALVNPAEKKLKPETKKWKVPEIKKGKPQEPPRTPFELLAEERLRNAQVIRQVIQGLKNMENGEFNILQSIDADQVNELLGDLFTENLSSNNVIQGYFDLQPEVSKPAFDMTV